MTEKSLSFSENSIDDDEGGIHLLAPFFRFKKSEGEIVSLYKIDLLYNIDFFIFGYGKTENGS